MAKDRLFLYGRNSVYERLKADPASIRKIFLQDTFNVPEIIAKIAQCRIPAERVSQRELLKKRNSDDLQGIVAETDGYRYNQFTDLLDLSADKRPTFLFLDRINDPHNLGAIIRTAACFGGFAVVIPEHEACPVTETVVHVASGGENYVPVCRVTNLAKALNEAKESGCWTAGAVVEGGEILNETRFSFPLCFVLGSEGSGIRHGIDKHLDFKVHIPMTGAALSLNVTMACAICCYEISKKYPRK